MTATVTAAPSPVHHAAMSLAASVAALLPERAGEPWTVEPHTVWWSTRPTARLVQGGRALVLVAHAWRTDVAWELPDREPYEPDLRLDRMAPEPIAREILRLVLPVLDDEVASRARKSASDMVLRLGLLDEIGHAMRMQGVATHNQVGLLVNTSTLVWGTPSGVRYSVTMHGSNPACDVQVHGPVRAVERAVALFLPEPGLSVRRQPLRGVRGRLQRRMAGYLGQYTDVDQLSEGGIAFGTGKGPCGYAAPAADSAARVRDTSPVAVDLHSVGVDLLVSLAPNLSR